MNRRFRWHNKVFLTTGFVLALALAGCSTSKEVVLTGLGTSADIVYSGGAANNLELLAWQDDTLFAMGDSLIAVPASQIVRIDIHIDEKRGWVLPVVLTQLVPSALLMFVEEGPGQIIGVGLGGLGLGAWALLEFSTPQARFRLPLSAEEHDALALHMRFPYGVDRGHLEKIGRKGRIRP